MDYLYGDSTASPLKSNFLEFLRDATDFGVFALQADDGINRDKERIHELRAQADAATQQLDRFIGAVSRAIDETDKGTSDSPAAQCAARLAALVASVHRTTTEEVHQRLAATISQLDAEEATSRAAVEDALATLLAPHDPPGTTRAVRLRLGENGTYEGQLTASAPFGLEWSFELTAPADNVWHTPVRVDLVAPHLELRTPQLTGFFSKEVKVRPLKLDRHVVVEYAEQPGSLSFKLRPEPAEDVGLDAQIDLETNEVRMRRVGPADDASVGPFEVHADDAAAVLELADKLRAGVRALQSAALSSAKLDGADVATLPKLGAIVERLVESMAPIVREISERSLTTTELVIRRALANDRREEIFVAKATLREKYAGLPEPLAAVFRPLGLEVTATAGSRRSEPPPGELPPTRAQLAPSSPPPALLPTPAIASRPTTTARPPASSTAAVPPPASPPPSLPASLPPRESSPPKIKAILTPVELSSDALQEAPESDANPPEPAPSPTDE